MSCADELELRVPEQVGDVLGRAGDEVIDRDDLVPLGEEPFAQVRADEPGPAGDERAHVTILVSAGGRERTGLGYRPHRREARGMNLASHRHAVISYHAARSTEGRSCSRSHSMPR